MTQGRHERVRVTPLIEKLKRRRQENKTGPKKKRQPLLVATVAVAISWAALKFGFPIDDTTADTIAGFLVLAALKWAHSRVTPVATPTLPVEVMPDLKVTGLDTAQTNALLRDKGII